MNVKTVIILFAIVTLFQLFHCKPTHRFVRDTNDEEEGRTNKIKEFFSQFYGGSTPQSSSPPNNPDSSTSNQSSSSEYQPDLLTSSVAETPAGPEAKD